MIDPISRCVAANLRFWRAVKGMSAQGLADRCAELGYPHLDRSLIAKIESAKKRRRVLVDELAVFARALDVYAEDLLSPSPPQPKRLMDEGVHQDEAAAALLAHQEAVQDIVNDVNETARWVVDGRLWLWARNSPKAVRAQADAVIRHVEMARTLNQLHENQERGAELLAQLARHHHGLAAVEPDTDKEK